MNSQRPIAVKKLPGEMGLWIFILSDLMLFGLYFVLFAYDLRTDPDAFYASQSHLNRTLGLINTLLLLTGSWAVVMGTRVEPSALKARKYLLAGALTGIAFLILKAVEYNHLFSAGISLTDSRFFTWYFFLTAYHGIHVAAGVVFLLYLATRMTPTQRLIDELRDEPSEKPSEELTEAAGCYWHLVDLLWIGIFTIAYLI